MNSNQTAQFKTLEPLVDEFNRSRMSAYSKLQEIIKSSADNEKYYEGQVQYYKDEVVKQINKRKEAEAQIKHTKDDRLTLADIVTMLTQVERHKMVNWAFLTQNLQLIIETKPLKQYDALLDKQLTEDVGRYAFRVGLGRYPSLEIFPLDFEAQGHRHPNMMSSPSSGCWGGFDSEVREMFRNGDFFAAIDAMVMFFSTFPQSGGHQPLYWYIWLNERNNYFKPNPYFYKFKEAIWTVGKPVEAKERKVKIKRVDVVKIGEEKIAIRGLQFRGY